MTTENIDLQVRPFLAVWETNQSFDGSSPVNGGQKTSTGRELTDAEAERLIRDIAELRPPVFVFAGGDPLRRRKIVTLVQYAASCGLHPHMVLTPHSAVTPGILGNLKTAGLSRLGITLHGATPELHEELCGVPGSFAQALQAIKWANECRLPVQVHTTVSRPNLHDLEAMAGLLKQFRLLLWSVYFLVPDEEQGSELVPSAEEFEQAFARIYALSQKVPFKIKTVEAQHYRRYVLQQKAKSRSLSLNAFVDDGIPGVFPVNETRGSLFVSNTGEVFPSRAMPISAGNVRTLNIADIYRDGEIFKALRDPAALKGKCGRCEFKQICGGSRARAWALAGDMFSEESSCIYQPISARKTLEPEFADESLS